jgi:Tfp pilus assembly protein PilP
MLFCFTVASATLEVIYKGPRGKKDLFKEKKFHDILTKSETQLRKGYVYNPVGKTDAFRSFLINRKTVSQKTKKKPKTYLETLDLSQLDLTAIIISPKGNWAMVRDAKGVGYVIRKGTPIGINGGVVYRIKEGEVIVREKHMDVKGQVKFERVSKKLPLLK